MAMFKLVISHLYFFYFELLSGGSVPNFDNEENFNIKLIFDSYKPSIKLMY